MKVNHYEQVEKRQAYRFSEKAGEDRFDEDFEVRESPYRRLRQRRIERSRNRFGQRPIAVAAQDFHSGSCVSPGPRTDPED